MENRPTPPPFPDDQTGHEEPRNPRGTNRKLIILSVSVLAVVLIAVIVFLLVRNKKSESKEDNGLKVTPSEVTVSADGGMATFTVEGESGWKLLNAPESWGSVAHDGKTIYWEAAENFSGERADTLKIGSGDKSCSIILKQESGAFYADPTSQFVSAGSNTVYYTIIGQKEWNVAVGPEGWGSVSREGDRLKWSVNENFGGEREDAVQLQAGKRFLTVTLTQGAALMAEKTNISAGSSGGTYRVEIAGPHDWECRCNEYWIHAGREENKVCIKVDKNNDSYSRDGVVYIYGGSQKIGIKVEQKKKSSGGSYPYYPIYPTYPVW